MKTEMRDIQTVIFDDEGTLQDVLNPKNVGAQSTRDSLKQELAKGPVVIKVPGQPDRALVTKESLEALVGRTLQGGDLAVIPFA